MSCLNSGHTSIILHSLFMILKISTNLNFCNPCREEEGAGNELNVSKYMPVTAGAEKTDKDFMYSIYSD